MEKDIRKELEKIEKEFMAKIETIKFEHKKRIQAILDEIELKKLND